MQIREIMSRNVKLVSPDNNLVEAARMMRDFDVGGLPVCADDRLCGFVTDRDIVLGAVAEAKNPSECTVGDVMCNKVYWCYEDEDVERAGQLMREKQIRRLMILDRNKRLTGIISLGDLAVDTDDEEFAGEVLEAISEPTQPYQPSA